jgi:hypothetical protein
MTDHANPNAAPGQPGATQPAGPLPLPDEFAARHVAAQHVGDVATARQALDAARRASETPNGPSELPTVDLRHGPLAAQAAASGQEPEA